MYKLDTGIEAPTPVPFGRAPKYPFAQMQVGDSFVLKLTDKVSAVKSAAHSHGSRFKMKFTVGRCPKNPHELRCWRIA